VRAAVGSKQTITVISNPPESKLKVSSSFLDALGFEIVKFRLVGALLRTMRGSKTSTTAQPCSALPCMSPLLQGALRETGGRRGGRVGDPREELCWGREGGTAAGKGTTCI